MLHGLGDINIEAVIGVLTGFGLCVIVPIVAMLLTHQRRMAELVNGNQAQRGVSDQKVAKLEAEVAMLRQQIAENIIAMDDHRSTAAKLAPPPPPQEIRERLS
jgi:hypothetical protein